MSLTAPDPFIPFWYKSNQDDEDTTTEFQIQGLSSAEYIEVISTDSTLSVLLAIKYGLKGWRNYNHSNGRPVRFSKIARENVNNLPAKVADELAGKIIKISDLTEDEVKNS